MPYSVRLPGLFVKENLSNATKKALKAPGGMMEMPVERTGEPAARGPGRGGGTGKPAALPVRRAGAAGGAAVFIDVPAAQLSDKNLVIFPGMLYNTEREYPFPA